MVSGPDLARTTLAVFFMVGLAAAALWILSPFLPALLWATMVVVALWPVLRRLESRFGGRRWAAAAALTAALLLALFIPLTYGAMTIASHAGDVTEWTRKIHEVRLPLPPDWLERVPVAGPKLAAAWRDTVNAGPEALREMIEPHARTVAAWILAQVGSVGMLFVQFLLTVVISAILFANGESAAAGVIGFFRKLAGAHGENGVILAARAIRSVALGVIVTAIVQSALAGIGIAVAGVPFAALLTALMFVLAVAQIGPLPVLVLAVVWSYWTSDSVIAPTALLVWSVFCGALDNILRPVLIKMSGDLPLIIVFAGVIGGLLSFGLIGIFLGPTVLAIVYTLLQAWVSGNPQPSA